MIAMHVPYEAPAESPAVISPSDKTIVHGCMQIGVDSQATWAEHYVDPIFIVKIHSNITGGDITNAATALVVKPEHGAIVDIIDSKTGHHNYRYDPQPGYTGKDKATFVVSTNSKTYRVVTDLIVVKDVYDGVNSSDSDPCDNPNLDNNNGDVSTPDDVVTADISSLDGGAVGKTVGSSITLDLSAAGYGWFEDAGGFTDPEVLACRENGL